MIFRIVIQLLLLSLFVILINIDNISFNLLSYSYLLIIIYICLSLYYLAKYRMQNLFCFETLFLLIYFIITFFKIIVIGLLDDISVAGRLFNQLYFPSKIENKSMIVSLIGFLSFILGATYANKNKLSKVSNSKSIYLILNKRINYTQVSNLLVFLLLIYIALLFILGEFKSWFQYSQNTQFDNTNIVFLTILLNVSTIIEFIRLAKFKTVSSKFLIRKINFSYAFSIIFIGGMLLISGNRNEALLIILPVFISYSIFIKQINNGTFALLLIIGAMIMIVIGLVREEGFSSTTFNNLEFGLFESTRDFGAANINTSYLIEYTDKFGPAYFSNSFLGFFSSFPFLGGIIKSVFGEGEVPSSLLTTIGMQDPKSLSGLGTSLVGDLYYTGGISFVIFYMYILGWTMSYLFNIIIIKRSFNVWLIIIYIFYFSNAIYSLRSEWIMPSRYIGFSIILVLFLFLLMNGKPYHKKPGVI